MADTVLLEASIDIGLAPPLLDDGRCCHDNVPDLARLDTLGEGFDADSVVSGDCAGL